MDKIELSQEDITKLLDWRNAHKELVRQLPTPKKAVEIVFKHNGYRIKGIRKGKSLKLSISRGYESLGNAEFEIGVGNVLKKKKGRYRVNEEGFQSVLTVYCSLMALMAYGTSGMTREMEADRTRKPSGGSLAKKPRKRVTYILKSVNGGLAAVPTGSHSSPNGAFNVRGHYRHYKSGKVVWIEEYTKGAGKKKPKTYAIGKIEE